MSLFAEPRGSPLDWRASARRPSAVIVGNHTQGLGILRSAGVAGYEVWMVNDASICAGRFSRFLAGYRRIRPGTFDRLHRPQSAEELLQALLNLPVQYPSVLFPINEDINCFIYAQRERLREKYVITDTPIDLIADKYRFNQLLPDSAQVETWLWSDLPPGGLEAPNRLILKGRKGNAFRQITGMKAMLLDRLEPRQIDRILRRIDAGQVMAQRVIETDRPVLSVCSLAIKGRIYGLFQYEKLRQHPDRFGTGTYLKSTRVDEATSLAAQILGRFNYTGISEIECLHDPLTGAYRVIEMNPRTWKSIHFATQCGQNMVAQYLYYVAAGQITTKEGYSIGRYWADLANDLPQMVREWRVFDYQPGFYECIWDKADPLPTVAILPLLPLIGLEKLYSKYLLWKGGPRLTTVTVPQKPQDPSSSHAKADTDGLNADRK